MIEPPPPSPAPARGGNLPRTVLAVLTALGLLGLPFWWWARLSPWGVLDAFSGALRLLAPAIGAGGGRPGIVPRLGPSAALRPVTPLPTAPPSTAGTRPEPDGPPLAPPRATPAPAPDAAWGLNGPLDLPLAGAFAPGWKLVRTRPAGGRSYPETERVATAADLPSLAAGDPVPLREALRAGFGPGTKVVGLAGRLLAWQVRPVGCPFPGAVLRARLPGAPDGPPAGPWEAWVYLALDGDGIRGAEETLAAAAAGGVVPLGAGDDFQLFVFDVTPPRAAPAPPRPGIVHLAAPFNPSVAFGGKWLRQTVTEAAVPAAPPAPRAAAPAGERPPAGALAALRVAFPDRADATERRTWSVSPDGSAVVEVASMGRSMFLRGAARDGGGNWRAAAAPPDGLDGRVGADLGLPRGAVRSTAFRVTGWPAPTEAEVEVSGEFAERPDVEAVLRRARVGCRYRLSIRPDGVTAGAPDRSRFLPSDAPAR